MRVVSIQSTVTYQTQLQLVLILLLAFASSHSKMIEALMLPFTSIDSRSKGRGFVSSQFGLHNNNYFQRSSIALPPRVQAIISSHQHHLLMTISDDSSEISTCEDVSNESNESTQEEMVNDEPILKEEKINSDEAEAEGNPGQNVDIEEEEMNVIEKVSMSDLLATTKSTTTKTAEQILNGSGSTNFDTTKEKRVPITIRYSEELGLRPYFLTTAKKIKESNPDVIVERRTVPTLEENKDEDLVFEVLVDDKIIVGKPQCKWQGVTRSGGNGEKENDYSSSRVFGMSVYISMKDVNEAIAKARRKRRPNTVYTQQGSMMKGVGLNILKGESTQSKE